MKKITSNIVYSTNPDFESENIEDLTMSAQSNQNLRIHLERKRGGKILTVIRGYGTSVGVTHADNTLVWKVGTPSNHTATTSVNPIMKLGVDQLPFTISGIMITGLSMWNTGAENNANDDVSILSFH